MSKDSKAQSKRRLCVGMSTHCTSYGIAKQFQLVDFDIPPGLYAALQNCSEERGLATSISQSYRNFLKSLSNVETIRPQLYLCMFKMFLYMEHYEVLKAAKQHTLHNHQITRIDDENCFSVKIPVSDDNDMLVDVGDRVRITDLTTMMTYYGRVAKLDNQCASIRLQYRKDIQEWGSKDWRFLYKTHVKIRFLPNNLPVKCCHYALNVLFKHNLTDWLYPRIETTRSPALDRDLDWQEKNVGNNVEQRQAVLNILNKSSHPAPYILFGPPGTGKTSTLAEAICQIWKRDRSEYILVCAQSNAAADEITKRLLKTIPDKDIYRMYTTCCKGIPEEIEQCSNIVDEMVVFLPKEIVLLKRIVVATLVTCTRLTSLNLRYDHFSYIFIDEVSQSVEPETLIPLTLTIKNRDNGQNDMKRGEIHAHIIIAGDPHQLGPVVKCQLIQHLYGKSLIERLMDCEPYKKKNGKYDPCYVTKLVRNFRSRGPILHVSNKLFYEGELQACAASNAKNISLEWPEIRNKTFPIVFCCIKGTETRTENKSVYNQDEVTAVIHYVKKLLRTKLGAKAIKESNIGIVTPFREQQSRIQRKLQQMNLREITVGTVEVFQGQEKPVIIFSTVRAQYFVHDGVEHIGHLSNPKRFNVGLTRAQLLLIVTGNERVLCKENCWQELYHYCEANDACIKIEKNDIEYVPPLEQVSVKKRKKKQQRKNVVQ